jgi:hypothetical protein
MSWDTIAGELGLNGPHGPMVLIGFGAFLASLFSVYSKERPKIFAPTAFAWAASATGYHFTFTVDEQYALVFGVFFGVYFFLIDPQSKSRGGTNL